MFVVSDLNGNITHGNSTEKSSIFARIAVENSPKGKAISASRTDLVRKNPPVGWWVLPSIVVKFFSFEVKGCIARLKKRSPYLH